MTCLGQGTNGLLQVQAELGALPAAGVHSSQGEGAAELKRLRDEERAVECEVRTPAPLS